MMDKTKACLHIDWNNLVEGEMVEEVGREHRN